MKRKIRLTHFNWGSVRSQAQYIQIKQNGKDKNIVSGYQSKIIAMALNNPSNKVIFFNNFSVFTEILEDNSNLKTELIKPSIYFSFSEASVFIIIIFI